MTPSQAVQSEPEPTGTIWGLSPEALHDRFWAARGVQIIRPGQRAPIDPRARCYLLMPRALLAIFALDSIDATSDRAARRLTVLRLHNLADTGYRERIVTEGQERFVRIERHYPVADRQDSEAALTARPDWARLWQCATSAPAGWHALHRCVSTARQTTVAISGYLFDANQPHEVRGFLRELVQVWQRPDSTIGRAAQIEHGVWADHALPTRNGTHFVGPVWIGAGRQLTDVERVVGPTVLWDATDTEPIAHPPVSASARPGVLLRRRVRPRPIRRAYRLGKRVFDIVFAVLAIVMTLPLYPLIMLAIWLEDGRPFLFSHKRESIGGRQFPCLKFRTMRKDAEQIKQGIKAANKSDGPHFFVEVDPRLTRVGTVLRRFNIDELPQFLNVLAGHMSVVGPRPSPYEENQFCPPWRDARLSVRPGVTGLWQIRRSRETGRDFQEWIRYDIAYVENVSWRLDLWIIWQTIARLLLRKL